jgi:selenide,water dikinase
MGKDSVAALDFPIQELLFDPQTSGGLLLSVPESRAESTLRAIRLEEPGAAVIGGVKERNEGEAIITFTEA